MISVLGPSQVQPKVRIPTDREPTHPGEMLREEFLIPMGITQRELWKPKVWDDNNKDV